MSEFDNLEGRLARFGRHRVPDEMARRHLSLIEAAAAGVPVSVGAAAASRRGQTWSRKMAVAGALLGGLLTGGMGLAAAGALPAPAQNVAHEALHAVGVDVPKPSASHSDNGNGDGNKPARSTDGCNGATVDNHGQFVSSQPKGDRSAAAQSDCGKPVTSVKPATTSPAVDDQNEPAEGPENHGQEVKEDHANSGNGNGNANGHDKDTTTSSSSTTVVHGNGNGNNGNGNGNGGGNGNGSPKADQGGNGKANGHKNGDG